MENVIASGNGLRPALVPFEIGRKETQLGARFGAAGFEQGAHIGLAFQAAYGGAHLVAGSE
jgi:hypothetical protein